MKNKDIPATLGFMLGLVLGTIIANRLGMGNLGRIILCIAVAPACGYVADLIYKRSKAPPGAPPGPPGAGPGSRIPAYCPRCGAPINLTTGTCPNCGKAA